MPKFNVTQDFSGYVRGTYRATIEADSQIIAEELFCKYSAEMDVCRDDTTCGEVEASEVIPYVKPKPKPKKKKNESTLSFLKRFKQ